MAGGIKIDEPAVDLAVCLAITSSLMNKPAKSNFVSVGEVGLGGEVRSIGQLDKRIQEAEKLGFENIIIPKNSLKNKPKNRSIKIIPVENISDAIALLLE